ncbi:tRNA (adenosine(37)-N6)-threonylcarbamoyltransferase complex dimerization subunit type 1 TsaB [Sphingomonas sp. BN140010]|uniref:tRNA (Adenosine(37)-N6)-threonylcarbamoyltransferase complex dimerization subunit type 1 TsaB n=1 Tax=Sphingomonas arvum TaxID=2992113 RepID=A0ABT3JHJ0_9SPHN|nr:tRNA (adenosine(37)-N6)-threonylcarbamoyltransferase complex dimerization subunit type 1 TsaB [Sphingomonas sp. BN140010]MCW3798523.1 tRNA (adenosine(37)-N6)-threonylcarbamoyltransferase complex dimerization subunit type 1 TsaB [Sphingomonas sp. BN140010]
MILALDTSTAACTAALFGEDGTLLASADEAIGRGHAERLVPMLDEMLAGRRADLILVGCGPGSFTGLRVGIAAAHGLAIGWGAALRGFDSLALLAASAPADDGATVAAAISGGHGELFVQQFDAATLSPAGPLRNLPPAQAAVVIGAPLVIGSGAAALVGARGSGQPLDAFPRAANLLRLPAAQRDLPPRPIYARAPDARPRAA